MSKKNIFTLSQFLALDTQRNIAVTAGAGAGKTAVLTGRLINILHNPKIDITEVLVVTFTDKAAAEMKERVYKAIEERISMQDDKLEHWKRLKENFLLNNISTFHSFCAGVLKKYSVEANIDPGFRIITDFEQKKLLGDAISLYINRVASSKNRSLKPDDKEEDFKQAQLAIKEDRKYLKRLIKVWNRTAILNNINYLINIREDALQWVEQFRDLSKERYFQDLEVYRKTVLHKIFNSMLNDPSFHDIFTRISNAGPVPADDSGQLSLRRKAILSLYKTVTETPVEEIDRLVELCGEILENINFSGSKARAWKESPENFDAYKIAASQLKASIQKTRMFTFILKKPLEEEGYQILRALAKMTHACYLQYQEEKAKRHMMDFADLQLKVCDLLRSPQYPHVLSHLRRRFRYIMVDEFQDTNHLQWEIIREIASDNQGLTGDKLFIVGDEKQAVYSFRGGDVTVFSKVRKAVQEANRKRGTAGLPFSFSGTDPEMSEKYRSAWNVLDDKAREEQKRGIITFDENFRTAQLPIDVINSFFHRLFGKRVYEEFEARPQSLICKGNLSEGSMELLLVEKESLFDENDQNAWEIAAMDNYLKEAHLIARKIKEIVISDDQKFQRTRESIARGRPAIAILLNRRTKIKIYEEALRRENIDFRVHKGKGFYQRREIMDIANVLEFLADQRHEISLAGFLRSPLCGLSDDGLMTLCRLGKGDGRERPRLWRIFCDVAEKGIPDGEFHVHDANALSRAHDNLSTWLCLQERLLLSDMIRRIIDDSGYIMSLSKGSRGEQGMANVEKLIEQAREFEKQESTRVYDFVQYLSAQIDDSENEGEADIDALFGSAVQLMTVHQSKGLEFPVVFAPDISASFNFGLNLPIYKDYIEYNPQFALPRSADTVPDGVSKIFQLGIKAPDEDADFQEENTLLRNIIFKMNVDKIRSERKRLLYVAMTRAMDHLYLVGQIKAPSAKQLQMDAVSTFDDYNNWSEWIRLIFGLDDINGMAMTAIQKSDNTVLKIPVTVFGPDDTVTEYTESIEVNAAELHRDIENVPDSQAVRSITENLSETAAPAFFPETVNEEPSVYSGGFSGKIVFRSSRRRAIEEKIQSLIRGRSDESICLYPTPGMSETAVKCGENHSLDEFVHLLYKRFGDGGSSIENSMQISLVAEIMEQHAGLLSHYSTAYNFPGMVKKFHQLVVKLNENGFVNLSDELKQVLRKPGLDPAEKDLAVIFEKYNEYLAENRLLDREAEYRAVHDLLRTDRCREFFDRYNTLILDRFYYLSPLEKGVFRELIRACPNVCITLEHGADTIEKSFAVTDDFRAFLDSLMETHNIKESAPDETPEPAMPDIALNIAVNRNEEIRSIAFSIRKLLRSSSGLNPADIVAAFPDPQAYLLLIRDQFKAYGVPYHIAGGMPLIDHQVVNLLLKLPALPLNHYQRDTLFGLLSSRLLSFHLPVDEIKDRLTVWLEKYNCPKEMVEVMLQQQAGRDFELDIVPINEIFKKTGILFGSNIDHHAERIIEYLDSRFTDEEEKNRRKTAILTRIFILGRVYSLLNSFRPSLTVEKFRDVWLNVIAAFSIRKNIRERHTSLHHNAPEEASHLINRDLRILDRIEEILKKMCDTLSSLGKKGKKNLPLNYLLQLFQRELRETAMPCGEKGGVRIIAVNELPGHLPRALYLGGLVDGELPAMPESPFILPATGDSSVLREINRLNEGRYLFSYALRNCEQIVTLSYPKSVSGKTLLVSPFIQEILKQGKIGLVEEGRRIPQEMNELFSERDALAFFTGKREESPEKALPVFKALYKKFPALSSGLIKVAEIESQRESFRGFGPYDGLLREEKNLEFLRSHYSHGPDKGHYYTIPQFDDYSQCPMNYFFKEVLRLTPVDGFIGDYEESEKGKLTHEILKGFHTHCVENKASGPAASAHDEEGRKELEKLMRKIAEAALESSAASRDNLFRTSDKETLIRGLDEDCKRLRMPKGTLKAFLEFEGNNKNRAVPYKPDFVFGRLPDNEERDNGFLYIGHIPVAGRIDRIDLSKDGDYLIFMDYRIGFYPAADHIGKGLSFQLPVHLLALKKAMQDTPYKVGAGGYFQIRSPKQIKLGNWFGLEDIRAGTRELKAGKVIASRQRGFGFFSEEELEKTLNLVEKRITQIDSSIKQGKFHLPLGRNDDLPCDFCDYSGICRKDQLRLEKIYDHIDENEYYKPLRFLAVKER